MKVDWRPWLNFKYPFRVTAPEIWDEIYWYQHSNPQPHSIVYVMKNSAREWIEELPKIGESRNPVDYSFFSKTVIGPRSNRPDLRSPYPSIWFARKADVLIFKLACGGR